MIDGRGRYPRRDVLRALGGVSTAGALTGVARPDPTGQALATDSLSGTPTIESPPSPPTNVFPQGVAAGDPTADGIVLWTRVAPAAYATGRPLELRVTTPETLTGMGTLRSVETGPLPDRDHTVKVDLAGTLAPDRPYYYQFVYDGVPGPVGRFRTLPAPGTTPDSVRFGVVTCQDYRNGYYGAYDHLLGDDVDYLLHLGDFIYETGGPSAYAGRDITLPSGNSTAHGLADFRHLYRTYRSDPALARALARYALVPTWDDHEIVNNRYWDYRADRPRTGDDAHPRTGDPEFVRQLFADGIQAWWEYMPVRVQYDPDAPLQDRLRLYRSFRFGDLLSLVVTDERLYRSRPDRDPTVDVSAAAVAAPGEADLDHTMLGATQREWFADTVARGGTTWTAWANEVLAMPLSAEYGGESQFDNADAWDGYESERRLLMRYLADRNVENFVTLSGDLHSALAGYLHVDYDDRTTPEDAVGVELMTPAVTSINLAEAADIVDSPFAQAVAQSVVLDQNPHIDFFDSFSHGYAVVEFTPEACEYTAYAVDKTVDPQRASRRELASFRVPEGESRLVEQ